MFRNYRDGHGYRERGKKKSFALSFEEFYELIRRDCFYCGKPPSNSMMDRARYGEEKFRFTGIDRADSRKGYLPGNCVPSCQECNRIKSNLLTVEEMVQVVKLLRKLRKRR